MAASYTDERLTLPLDYTPGKIGVVTVLYNSAPVLEGFFASIEQQTYPDYTVYCVDNASSDNSVEQCRARGPRYRVIENDANLGVPAGNNVGIRAAIADGCDLVLFLNNDVVFGPELFQQLADGLEQHHCAMTTPIMYYFDRPNVIWTAGGFFQKWLGYRPQHHGDGDADTGQYPAPVPVQYTPTCCVLVRRQLFATVGLMDERYFVYYDDTDFMLRAAKAGERLFLLSPAKLWHKVSSLVGTSSPFRTRYVHRNHAFYIHKHLPPSLAWAVSSIYCAVYLLSPLAGRFPFAEAFTRIRHWKEGIHTSRTPRARAAATKCPT